MRACAYLGATSALTGAQLARNSCGYRKTVVLARTWPVPRGGATSNAYEPSTYSSKVVHPPLRRRRHRKCGHFQVELVTPGACRPTVCPPGPTAAAATCVHHHRDALGTLGRVVVHPPASAAAEVKAATAIPAASWTPGRFPRNEVLALQVESCSPRLIASRVDACWRPSGFRPGFWPQGQSKPVYSCEPPPTPKGRRVAAMAGPMAKIRKWRGLGKKS
jgi:hypothetical protein